MRPVWDSTSCNRWRQQSSAAPSNSLIRNTELSARDIAEKALKIAGDICVYTNQNIVVEELPDGKA